MAERETEIYQTAEPPVLHIFVVGFHHQKGATVEFVWPPLITSDGANPDTGSSYTRLLPPQWKHLPHLALPDGCHNYEEDSVFFTLPSLADPIKQPVYGVACCRQIDSKDLPHACEDVTRSTVQKSVCMLSRFPIFGFIEAKLKLVTHAYFNTKDFSDFQILQEAYEQLNMSINLKSALKVIDVGVSQRQQVLRYQHRLLQVFKSLLLRKRVLVFGAPVKDLCSSVLAIASLFPLSLESLVDSECTSRSEYGFPLRVFPQLSLQPYLSLQQIGALTNEGSSASGILAGVVNPLFEKQKRDVCDVFVNMEGGLISIQDPELKPILHLTVADLRFCSLLTDVIRTQDDGAQHSDWQGSNEWLQSQFSLYLLSLLATSCSGDTLAMDDFNPAFMVAWLESPVYRAWLETKHKGISVIEPRHICEGELSVGDLKRRLVAQASDYGLSVQSREQVAHVMEETQKVISQTAGQMSSAVSGMWSAASTAVYSWWSRDSEPNSQ